MDRDCEHGRVRVESVLGAVPMMDVPVHDRDTGKRSSVTRMHGGQGGIAEDAEATTSVLLRMMARRPHQRVSVVHLAVEDGIHSRKAPAGCQQRDLVGAGTEWRLLACLTTRFRAHP